MQLRLLKDDASLRDEYQSPAFGLGHELDHYSSPFTNRIPLGPLWTNNEEKRVVTEWENPVADTLGEAKRTNHLGPDAYRTSDPLGVRGGVLDPSLLTREWRDQMQADPAFAARLRGGPLGGR